MPRPDDPHRWMPFAREREAEIGPQSFIDFLNAYLEASLWSSTDDFDMPLDEQFTPEDIAQDTFNKMYADAASFYSEHWDDIQQDFGRAGHDFWLTRNGHGAGFLDGDWPEEVGERLTEAATAYGTFDLYVGDDGLVHGM